ncbi:MAG: aminoglycoside phosphotransferase family protein [Solirubrobacteraceae bacterium]|nr:aminoglycoside phosphotransferase family protein [Solirubrobacteraceae bacterium]
MSDARIAAIARAAGRTGLTTASRAWEIATRPRARTADDIPVSAAAITEEWLTAVLCHDHPGVSVVRAAASDATSQTTSRVALRLTYSDGAPDDLPRDVFVKLTSSGRQRLFLGLIRIIDGEPEFYDRLRPLAEFECPVGYFGAHHPRSWASAVVIENIAVTRGATFCHADTPIDRAGIESLVATMASYHGQYWEHPAIVDSSLKRPADHVHNVGTFINMRRQARVGAERAGDRFPAELADRHDELWDGLRRSVDVLSHRVPPTLLHGDPHVGNVYRTADGRLALTDWQVVMRGGWAYDFADAIASALTVEDRRAWERDLLELYLERLERAGGHAPELDDAWRLYRQSLFYPLFCWATVLGAPGWMPDTQPVDVTKVIIERTATAIADLGALDVR